MERLRARERFACKSCCTFDFGLRNVFRGGGREPTLFVSFGRLPVICVCGEPSSLLSSFRPDYSGSVDPPRVAWTLPILAYSTFRHRRTVITGRIGSIQFNVVSRLRLGMSCLDCDLDGVLLVNQNNGGGNIIIPKNNYFSPKEGLVKAD